MEFRIEFSTVLVTVTLSILTGKVSGYYCDSGKCDEDEYCCGYNTCCTAYVVWQNWYFWCGMLFFMLLLSACASFWRYRLLYYRATILMQTGPHSYAQLQQQMEEEDDSLGDINIQDGIPGSSHVPQHYSKYINKSTTGDYRPMPPPYSQQLPKDPPPPYSD